MTLPIEGGLTAGLREAIAESERLLAEAGADRTEAERLEAQDYLAGRIRGAIQMAFDRDPERPVLINSTHQYMRQGLDNPDALYFHAFIDDRHEYVVRGVRGSTADLSLQVMSGGYSADGAPESLATYGDRDLDLAPDGGFELRLAPPPPGARTLVVREVYNDWERERRGVLWIERTDLLGRAAVPPDAERVRRRWQAAGSMLTGSIRAWLAFPEFFQNKEPVNTLTPPRQTPGGLDSQRSSIGHYRLEPDEALVVTVPECHDCAYQGFQLGSHWYVSTDYESHQTSLTKAQAVTDPDGRIRYVVSERDPGIANWLETTGHAAGPMMMRWQRLERGLGQEDGPVLEVVPFDDVPKALPWYAPITPDERAARITARQRAVARRMLS